MSEFEAMGEIEKILSQFDDKETKMRIVAYFWHKYGDGTVPTQVTPATKTRAAKSRRTQKTGVTKARKTQGQPKIVKGAPIRTEAGVSLKDYCEDKQPSSYVEKIAVLAYFYSIELGVEEVSVDHIYTGFKAMGWRLPSDLPNVVHQTGSRGWLDTANRDDIKVVPLGENLVEHDLPRKREK